jgi:hypothetical protein
MIITYSALINGVIGGVSDMLELEFCFKKFLTSMEYRDSMMSSVPRQLVLLVSTMIVFGFYNIYKQVHNMG